MTTTLIATRKLLDSLREIEKGASRELNLAQIMMLLEIARAGDAGMDQGHLAEATGASPAAVSRTVRIFGRIHYAKQHAGFGLVEHGFDPTDNRRRIVRLSRDGQALIGRVAAHL